MADFETGEIVRYIVEGPILALVETHEGMGVVLGIGGAEATVISGRALDLIQRDPDPRDAEIERLRAKLDSPCGSCHPCTNYADETWRAAGRTPPHVYQWDELTAKVDAVHALHLYEIHGGQGVCGSCRDSSEDPMPWPCPTMAALGEQPTRGDL